MIARHPLESPRAAFVFAFLWLCSAYAWISNAIAEANYNRNYLPAFVFAVFLLFAILLFFTEGMEIAFGDLRDKDPDQLGDGSTRILLQEIQSRYRYFFSQRQVVAVSILTFVTILVTDTVKTFQIWGIGTVGDVYAGIINFFFINILVLCACQILPKQLALTNSEYFLSKSRFTWWLIKFSRWINFSAPSDYLAEGLLRLLKLSSRNLAPSRAVLFNYTALIHGFCVDQRAISLELNADGSGNVEIYTFVLFLHGRRKETTARYRAGEKDTPYINNIELLGAWKLPPVEDLKTHEDELNKIFSARKSKDFSAHATKFTALDFNGRVEKAIPSRVDPSKPDWLLKFLDQMPEGTYARNSDERHIVGVLYKASGTAPPGSFYIGGPDTWKEHFITACRTYYFDLTSGGPSLQVAIQGCEAKLDNPTCLLPDESARAAELLRKTSTIRYPIQSSYYFIEFDSVINS